MGRRIEQAMLHVAVEYARSRDLHQVCALYRQTARNKPCLEFWSKSSGFRQEPGTTRFVWDLASVYASPEAIELRLIAPEHD